MACNECGQTTDPCVEGDTTCNCPAKDMSTDCSVYTGDDLACSGILKNTVLTVVISDIDAFICNKFAEAIQYLTLINIGSGAEIYRGITGIGNKEIRTIVSEDTTLLDIVQNADTIGIQTGTHMLDLDSGTDILSLLVTTIGGTRTLDTVDLTEYNYDTFVQGATFSSGTLDLTITRNNSEPDIVIPLDFLSNYVTSGAYASDTITLTLLDASTVDIDVATLVSEILASAAAAVPPQVKSDYLEANSSSDAFIQNKNPSKTETLGAAATYTVVTADNNKIIEVDNGVNNVTIAVGALSETTEFFVGFIQKGTGTVTFTGHDIFPTGLGAIIFGQGHVAALEIIASTKYIHGTLKA